VNRFNHQSAGKGKFSNDLMNDSRARFQKPIPYFFEALPINHTFCTLNAFDRSFGIHLSLDQMITMNRGRDGNFLRPEANCSTTIWAVASCMATRSGCRYVYVSAQERLPYFRPVAEQIFSVKVSGRPIAPGWLWRFLIFCIPLDHIKIKNHRKLLINSSPKTRAEK
jgi:hypothetical protein